MFCVGSVSVDVLISWLPDARRRAVDQIIQGYAVVRVRVTLPLLGIARRNLAKLVLVRPR